MIKGNVKLTIPTKEKLSNALDLPYYIFEKLVDYYNKKVQK
jgi:hypothetical protein